jgi:hypothetical protein
MLRIMFVDPLDDHWLRLGLTDGRVVERNVQDLLAGPVFIEVRRDPSFFRRARVRHGTVVWPGGADIDPDVLIWDGPALAGDRVAPPDRLRLTRPTVSTA